MTDIYVNFVGSSQTAAAPWSYNEPTFTSGTGVLVADLNDDSNSATGYALEITSAFQGSVGSEGWATVGAGGWPESVFDACWYSPNAGTSTFKFTGLPVGGSYTVELAGHNGNARDTDFTVEGSTSEYNTDGSATPTAPLTFSGTVDGDGEVVISLTLSSVDGSLYGYVNGVKLSVTAATGFTIDSTPSEINPETSFSIQVSGPATAPTTGNTTGNFTGLTGIAPDSVTGSDPYTITWTLPRTTAKLFDATGYVFDITIDAETASTSAIPYEPPTGSDYITVGTIDTGAQVYTDYTGGTFVSTDQLVWDNSPSLSFTDDLNFVVTGTLSATVYRISSAGTVDIENTMSFTLGNDGIVTAVVSPMVSNLVSSMVN